MNLYYDHAGITIYHGDCRDWLAQDKAALMVDAVVTDPPFGIGFKYESHDDTSLGYREFLWPVIEKAESLCAPSSPIFVWQAMPNIRHFAEWFPRDWRMYAALKNFVQIRPTVMQYAFDPVLAWWTAGTEKPWVSGSESRDWFIADTAGVISRKTYEKRHPCPRPIGHLRHVISQWVRPRGIVFDPFMGSGTTLVAAKSLSRRAIGIEIEEHYCEIAVKRLEQEVFSFTEPAPIPEQLTLAS